MTVKRSWNAGLGATLLLLASAAAFAQCPTATGASVNTGGTCTLTNNVASCSQPKLTQNGSCNGTASTQACNTSTKIYNYSNWKPAVVNSCSGGCITDGQKTAITATQAGNSGACIVEVGTSTR